MMAKWNVVEIVGENLSDLSAMVTSNLVTANWVHPSGYRLAPGKPQLSVQNLIEIDYWLLLLLLLSGSIELLDCHMRFFV